MRRILGVISSAFVLSAMLVGCGGDDKATLALDIDPETTPTMLTHDVSTLISDSGYTRYHMTAPVWYVFGESKTPRWTFPEGMFIEKYDDNMAREATVECDSATYFEKRKLWRLDGNVRIRNVQNERFSTEQLFWDQRSQRIYSDSFIHIERHDRIIEGYGFNSNDRLTDYEVNRVSGIFPAAQFHPGVSADSAGARQPRHDDDDTALSDSAAASTPDTTAAGEQRRRIPTVKPRRIPRPQRADSVS